MKTFKGDVAGKQFYFKPKKDGVSYLVEPYQQTGAKSFSLVQRKADDAGSQPNEWMIPATEVVSQATRDNEAAFSATVLEYVASGRETK